MSGLLRRAWHSRRMAVAVFLLVGLAAAWNTYNSYAFRQRSDALLATIQERLAKENALPLFSLIDPGEPEATYFCIIGPYGSAERVPPLDRADFPWGSGWLENGVREGSLVIVILSDKLELLRSFELNRYKLGDLSGISPGRCYQRQDEPVLLRESKDDGAALVIQSKTP